MDLPIQLGPGRPRPTARSRFLISVDFLALTEEANESAPVSDPFPDCDNQVGFACFSPLVRHVGSWPTSSAAGQTLRDTTSRHHNLQPDEELVAMIAGNRRAGEAVLSARFLTIAVCLWTRRSSQLMDEENSLIAATCGPRTPARAALGLGRTHCPTVLLDYGPNRKPGPLHRRRMCVCSQRRS